MIETAIQLSGYKHWLSDAQAFEEHLTAASEQAQAPFAFPAHLHFQSQVDESQLLGSPVVQFNNHGGGQPVVLYLYGGAFVDQPEREQWKFCDRLAQSTDARIIVPLYPLVPGHHYQDDYRLLHQLYHDLIGAVATSMVTLIGDSAGALLALGFAESLAEKGLPQPSHLVLFSPWLDLTLSNPLIAKYEPRDVMLASAGLRRIGQMWAGQTNRFDYHLSPIKGDLTHLRDVQVYVGTNEIMAPDVFEFDQLLRKAAVKSRVTMARGLFHTYPLYDFPEGREVASQVATLVRNTTETEY